MSSTGVRTEAHIDAGGFCTFVQVVLGQKEWFIADVPHSAEESPRTRIPLLDSGVVDVREFNWIRIMMGPGSSL